jgi:hypothetical protein
MRTRGACRCSCPGHRSCGTAERASAAFRKALTPLVRQSCLPVVLLPNDSTA